jgi:hypothetical protein
MFLMYPRIGTMHLQGWGVPCNLADDLCPTFFCNVLALLKKMKSNEQYYVTEIDRFDAVPYKIRQTKSLGPKTPKCRQHQREYIQIHRKKNRGVLVRLTETKLFRCIDHHKNYYLYADVLTKSLVYVYFRAWS